MGINHHVRDDANILLTIAQRYIVQSVGIRLEVGDIKHHKCFRGAYDGELECVVSTINSLQESYERYNSFVDCPAHGSCYTIHCGPDREFISLKKYREDMDERIRLEEEDDINTYGDTV